jgi:PAS domain S-box-containing protein
VARRALEPAKANEKLQRKPDKRRSPEKAKGLAREYAIMAEIGRIISSSLNIDEVYQPFAEQVNSLVPFDRIVINMIDPQKNTVVNVYMAGEGIADRKVGRVYPLEGSGNAEMVRTKSTLLIQTEDFMEYRDRFPMLLSTFQAGFRSILNVPLFSKGRIIGGLLLRSFKPYAYTDEHVRLAEGVGAQIAGAIANAQLFIEHKRVEEALRQSEEKYRTIIQYMEDGYYEIDLYGNFTFVNDSMSRILGYSQEELLGLNYRAYMDEETAKRIYGIFNLLYQTGKDKEGFDWVFQRKDGFPRNVETSVNLIKDETGKSLGFRGVLRDITERKKVEEAKRIAHEELEKRVEERTRELALANQKLKVEILERERAQIETFRAKEAAEAGSRAKSEFLANMSHELRTPLNHIIGFTELLVDKAVGNLNETQEEYMNDVLSSGRHLFSLINNILDLSKAETGRLDLEFGEVDLSKLMESSLMMVRKMAIKHRIELKVDMHRVSGLVRADERKLKQVMYNLLSNAVKFTPDGGKVEVCGEFVDGASVKVVVRDTGIGIEVEDLGRIFRPFEQGDNSASRRYQGTGLGLTLAKKLVELHGGRVWAESEGKGKGSTFSFVIPV